MWVHRDIKSGNVLISNEDDLKICDLGEAVRHSEKNPFKGKKLRGTPAYLAPELMPGSSTKIDDFKTDIYSLGVLFWEILEGGEYPYKEHIEKTGATNEIFALFFQAVIGGLRPVFKAQRTHEVPVGVLQLIQSMWDLDPGKRPRIDFVVRTLEEVLFLQHLRRTRTLSPARASSQDERGRMLRKTGLCSVHNVAQVIGADSAHLERWIQGNVDDKAVEAGNRWLDYDRDSVYTLALNRPPPPMPPPPPSPNPCRTPR